MIDWARERIKRKPGRKKITHMTMMVIPHSHGIAVKNYCFPMWVVRSFLVVSVTCILTVGYFITGFFYFRYLDTENRELKQVNSVQAKEIDELKGLTGNMKSRLESLIKLDQEVRAKMGLTGKTDSSDSAAKAVNVARSEARYQFITMGLTKQGETSFLTQRNTMVPYADGGGPGAIQILSADKTLPEQAEGFMSAEGSEAPDGQLIKSEPDTLEELKDQLQQMDELITEQTENMEKVSKDFDKQAAIERAMPNLWPLRAPLSSYFGWRKSPFSKSRSEFHDGIDINGDYGAPIRAAADGVVTFAGWSGAWGRMILISHGYGYVTRYGHNSALLVKQGAKVEKGQIIARLGSTGRSTGSHLHFSIAKNGQWINPLTVLK